MRSTCAVSLVLVLLTVGCGSLDLAALSDLIAGEIMLDGETQTDAPEELNDDTAGDDTGQVDDEGATGDDTDTDTEGNTGGDVDSGGADDSAGLNLEDFSTFRQFSFARAPGLGFCPPVDEVYAASIFVDAGGSYVLNVSVLREGVAGLDPCIDTFVVPCATATQLQERTLTSAEVAAVTATFSAVQVEDERDPICEDVSIDPCVINQFAWDSLLVTDFRCGAPRLPSDQASAIIDFLEQLRR